MGMQLLDTAAPIGGIFCNIFNAPSSKMELTARVVANEESKIAVRPRTLAHSKAKAQDEGAYLTTA